jgi:hypothetical protein
MDSLLGQSLSLASKLIANANSLTTEALPPSSSSSYPSSSSSLSPLHPTPSPLLLLPLLASTSSLTLSLSHYLSIRPLVHSEVSDEQIPPRAVQRYWDAWWVAGLGSAGLVGVVGTIGGMVELSGRRWATRQTQGAFVGLGTMFMLGGFTFTPKVRSLYTACPYPARYR